MLKEFNVVWQRFFHIGLEKISPGNKSVFRWRVRAQDGGGLKSSVSEKKNIAAETYVRKV